MRPFGIERCFVDQDDPFLLCLVDYSVTGMELPDDKCVILNNKGQFEVTPAKQQQKSIANFREKIVNLSINYKKNNPNFEFPDYLFDPSVVELSSPILNSVEQARVWFNHTEKFAKIAGLTACHDLFPNAGGGHIHIGLSNKADRIKVINQAALHPYVFWSTISASDELNACVRKQVYMGGQKYQAIADREYYDTIEWRAWDSAADWEIQLLQINLTQRFVEHMLQMQEPVSTTKIQDTIKFYMDRPDRCKESFKGLIKTLGLKWSDYSWLIARNLLPRFEYGDYKKMFVS